MLSTKHENNVLLSLIIKIYVCTGIKSVWRCRPLCTCGSGLGKLASFTCAHSKYIAAQSDYSVQRVPPKTRLSNVLS